MKKLEEFKRFFWNPETRTCLGRTGESWAKLVAFYLVLYSCLATIWTLYFHLFHLTISDKYPKWQLDESIIGSTPGLGLRPQSPAHRVESALISFREGPDGDYDHWVSDLANFLEATHGNGSSETSQSKQSCSADRDPEAYCPVDRQGIPAECGPQQNFSFPLGQPCLLVKLNRIYGWRPEPYDSPPPNYPKGAPFTPGYIQVTCEGQHDADKEHLGPVSYFPAAGIPTSHYPFLNQPGYQSPYVMVHFKGLKRDTLIYVECKAWARNVEHDRYNKKGMTSFELFVERPAAKPA